MILLLILIKKKRKFGKQIALRIEISLRSETNWRKRSDSNIKFFRIKLAPLIKRKISQQPQHNYHEI